MIDFSNVKQWNIGNNEVIKAELNNVVVWEKPNPIDYDSFFYIENLSDSSMTVTFMEYSTGSYSSKTIYWSFDKTTWNSGHTTQYGYAPIIYVPANSKLYIKANVPNGWRQTYFYINKDCIVGGNIMSLLYGDSFKTYDTVPFGAFAYLFKDCTTLQDASKLALPTGMNEQSYMGTFWGCSSLLNAPVLPSTVTASNCYNGMFADCISLTTAPDLPATTLNIGCYDSMFSGCTSLIKSPVLRASTLVSSCYKSMFADCTNLNHVECLATDLGSNNTNFWLRSVAASGTFVKHPNATWPSGSNGIPTNWTVENANI